ncbi:hypothetical protein [uncultured Rhodoblastus sp.]|uniref:hypothetical protein n=1 Tax=uncultured Rhodoblastus sp. TaxID=543037 RepID=UPI0025E11E5F|nr:hypothetical protein [uncultured Rhodoblastus sp.]
MTRLYRADMRLYATVYVRAPNKTAARRVAREFANHVFEFSGDHVSNRDLDDPDLPEISLSPAMTGNGHVGAVSSAED